MSYYNVGCDCVGGMGCGCAGLGGILDDLEDAAGGLVNTAVDTATTAAQKAAQKAKAAAAKAAQDLIDSTFGSGGQPPPLPLIVGAVPLITAQVRQTALLPGGAPTMYSGPFELVATVKARCEQAGGVYNPTGPGRRCLPKSQAAGSGPSSTYPAGTAPASSSSGGLSKAAVPLAAVAVGMA